MASDDLKREVHAAAQAKCKRRTGRDGFFFMAADAADGVMPIIERLQARLAERDAEVARLVAAIRRHRPAGHQPLRDVCVQCTNWWPCPTIQVLDAALAARGGEGQG